MQISNPFPAWIPNPLEVDFVSGTLLNRLYAKYSLQRLLFLQTNNHCAGWEIMSAFHMAVEYMGWFMSGLLEPLPLPEPVLFPALSPASTSFSLLK